MKLFTVITLLSLIVSFSLSANGEQESTMMTKSESTMMGPLSDFTDMDNAMMQAEEKPTVLFFHASWCPSCKSARKDFEENLSRLEGVNLLVVDYDDSKELQKKYGVTYQHTFVQISPSGEALAKWNGGGTDELLGKIMVKEM